MDSLSGLSGLILLLAGGGLTVVWRRQKGVWLLPLLLSLGAAGWSFYQAIHWPKPVSTLFSMVWVGGLYSLITGFVALSAGLGVLFLYRYQTLLGGRYQREAYALALWAAGSAAFVGASNHLLLSIVALETTAFALIVLVAHQWASASGNEAAVKYFLFSAVATAFILFGLSYIYGITGTLYLHHLRLVDWTAWQDHFLYRMGVGFVVLGMLIKLSIFPLHWWAPDAYGGATPGVAGLAAGLGKVVAALFLGRFVWAVPLPTSWQIGLAFLAAASALYGNWMATIQPTIQRLLGYSSIAHGGYLLLALVSGVEGLLQGWAYALAYALMSGVAFGLAVVRGGPAELSQLRGLGYAMPGYGLGLTLSLVTLAGMPPFMGFFAKYGVMLAAFRAGHVWPAILALLGALIGYYAYWRPVSEIYQGSEGRALPLPVLSLASVLLILIGVLPLLLWGWLDHLYSVAGYFVRG